MLELTSRDHRQLIETGEASGLVHVTNQKMGVQDNWDIMLAVCRDVNGNLVGFIWRRYETYEYLFDLPGEVIELDELEVVDTVYEPSHGNGLHLPPHIQYPTSKSQAGF